MESPKKNLQNLIFSPEFMEAVSRAIENAVAESDAAGLPPAYEPAFTKLKEFRDDQKKSREELIELCRYALPERKKKDHVTLEFHLKVFDLLEEGGQPAVFIMRKAREMIQIWESKGLNSKYGPKWKQLLDESPASARDFILSVDQDIVPVGFQSSSPFVHIAVYPGDEWEEGESVLSE